MGGGRQVGGKLRLAAYLLESVWSTPVAKAADEPIDGRVLAKFAHARRQYHQLPAIGDGHARSINGLVAQPGRLVFQGIKVHHDLPGSALEPVEVHLPA